MRLVSAALALACLFAVLPARAGEPDVGAALFSGAAVQVAGFIAGGTLLGTSRGANAQNNAGWLTLETGFVLAPWVAHGTVHEWARGALFAAAPASGLAATAVLFAAEPGAVDHGSLPQQRWMWAFFGANLFASAAGIVDAMFAARRVTPIVVQPVVGAGEIGVRVGGSL